jgi:hypothetical protein
MPDTPSLSRLVRDYLAQQSGQALKPWQIAEGVSAPLDGRHLGVGAGTNICLYEAPLKAASCGSTRHP